MNLCKDSQYFAISIPTWYGFHYNAEELKNNFLLVLKGKIVITGFTVHVFDYHQKWNFLTSI